LGEDGPTHQPVEHVSSLRLIPNLETWRPADAFETALAWQAAIERRDGPTALALSRQNLPPLPHPAGQAEQILRGGYVVHQPVGEPQAIIIATGSEVSIAIDAARQLADLGVAVRVVSMPCAERFLKQDDAYRSSVLPKNSKRLAVEAGVTHYWRGFVGDDGDVIGVDTFGESAPAPALFEHFGLTVRNIVSRVQALLG